MEDRLGKLRFTVRELLICTALVGVCLAALKYPFDWVVLAIESAVLLSVAYAITAACASTGRRRLSCMGFAATAVLFLFFLTEPEYDDLASALFEILQPVGNAGHGAVIVSDRTRFDTILGYTYVLSVSVLAAYAIPWLVQYGRKSNDD